MEWLPLMGFVYGVLKDLTVGIYSLLKDRRVAQEPKERQKRRSDKRRLR